MLRDAETTSIAERMRRPPLGDDTVPAAFGGGGPNNFFRQKIKGLPSYEYQHLNGNIKINSIVLIKHKTQLVTLNRL